MMMRLINIVYLALCVIFSVYHNPIGDNNNNRKGVLLVSAIPSSSVSSHSRLQNHKNNESGQRPKKKRKKRKSSQNTNVSEKSETSKILLNEEGTIPSLNKKTLSLNGKKKRKKRSKKKKISRPINSMESKSSASPTQGDKKVKRKRRSKGSSISPLPRKRSTPNVDIDSSSSKKKVSRSKVRRSKGKVSTIKRSVERSIQKEILGSDEKKSEQHVPSLKKSSSQDRRSKSRRVTSTSRINGRKKRKKSTIHNFTADSVTSSKSTSFEEKPNRRRIQKKKKKRSKSSSSASQQNKVESSLQTKVVQPKPDESNIPEKSTSITKVKQKEVIKPRKKRRKKRSRGKVQPIIQESKKTVLPVIASVETKSNELESRQDENELNKNHTNTTTSKPKRKKKKKKKRSSKKTANEAVEGDDHVDINVAKNITSLENQQPEVIISTLLGQNVVDSSEIVNDENSINVTLNEIDVNKELNEDTQNLQTKKKKRKKKRSRKKTKTALDSTLNSNQTQTIDNKSSKNEESQVVTDQVNLSNVNDDQNGNENVKAFVRTSAISFVSDAIMKDTESQIENENSNSNQEKADDIESDKNYESVQDDKCDEIDEDEQENTQIDEEKEVQDEFAVTNNANDGFENADSDTEVKETSQNEEHEKEDQMSGIEDEELLEVENNDAEDNEGNKDVNTDTLEESEDGDEVSDDEDEVETVVDKDVGEENEGGVENAFNEDIDEHVAHDDDSEDNEKNNENESKDRSDDESSVTVKIDEEEDEDEGVEVDEEGEITQEDIEQKEAPVQGDHNSREDEIGDVVDDDDEEEEEEEDEKDEDEEEDKDKVKSINEYEMEGQATKLPYHDNESSVQVETDKDEGDEEELEKNIEQNEILDNGEDDGLEGQVVDEVDEEEKECEVSDHEDDNFVKVESEKEQAKEDVEGDENDEEPDSIGTKKDEENKIGDDMKVGEDSDHADEHPVEVESDEEDEDEVENDEYQKEAENEEIEGSIGQNNIKTEGGVSDDEKTVQNFSDHVLQNNETEEKDVEDDNTEEKEEEEGEDEMDEKETSENDEDDSQERVIKTDDSIEKLSDGNDEIEAAVHDSDDDDDDDDSDDGMQSDQSMSPGTPKVDQSDHAGIVFSTETESQDNTDNDEHSALENSSEVNNGTSQEMSLNDLDHSNHKCLSVLGGDDNINSSQDTNEKSDNGAPEKKEPSIETHDLCTDVSEGLDDSKCITVSVVTWNLAESSPSEEEAAFIKKFRNTHGNGSDIVLIGGQETENTKPRRAEGSRSRELRRLMIKMLGKNYIPLALHSLGGVQFGLFCKRDILEEIEYISVADVACGIGNVFHNKGAIAAFLQMKARNGELVDGKENRQKSVKMLFVNSHLAAHVKNVDARNSDYWRIVSELEAQAPPMFLRPRRSSSPSAEFESNNDLSGGEHLINSIDHVFFCGDLNYRIELPREHTQHLVSRLEEILESDRPLIEKEKVTRPLYLELLRHDQLSRTLSTGRAFPGFTEGKISFSPTFKFDKGTSKYDTSHKQRIPAWTDRILFKPFGVQVLEYDAATEAIHSDHRPVFGSFRASLLGRIQNEKTSNNKTRNSSKRKSRRNISNSVENSTNIETVEPASKENRTVKKKRRKRKTRTSLKQS